MPQTMFVRRSLSFALSFFFLSLAPEAKAQQRSTTGGIAGVVATDDGKPVPEATVRLSRNDGTTPRDIVTAADGTFRFPGLAPGLYRLTARRIGFREAQLLSLRIVAGQTSEIKVQLTASPTQLSTVEVRVSPTAIDATTSELARRIDVANVALVPTARDANGLVELLPGASRGFVWGGGGDAANNYQLDGVSVNHPGVGGDFLAPSIDWVEALEVRGLGAGAEYGGFQGGLINAITKSGTNNWQGSVRANYISPSLTTSNIKTNEEGAEQAMRREFSGEMRGPIIRDRLFYFVGGILIDRDLNVPNLDSTVAGEFRDAQQNYRDIRGIAKVTLLPSSHDRVDGVFGRTDNRVERFGLNGLDDPAATSRVRAPTSFYELGYSRNGLTSSLDARLAGFDSRETRGAYEGTRVPGIQVFSRGRQPRYQNAPFTETLEPRSLGGNISWKKQSPLPGGENKLVVGAEYTRGWWQNHRARNGGLTWMPYLNPSTGTIDPADPRTWPDVANQWGGEIRLESDVEDAALFVQDYLTLLPNLTFTPGLRYGRWTGWLTPADPTKSRFRAARHQAFDPRLGVVWDLSGRNDFVLKAHWGRYHQSMNSVFFDRAEGADVYTNERFYFQGPDLTDPRKVYTPAERDAMLNPFTGFSQRFVESILNEAGEVENYRQPYVEQAVLSAEKKFGPKWKLELVYTNRINKDIVGLVDRNLAQNYSPLTNVAVKDGVFGATIFDQYGAPLRLPVVWVSNQDLRNDLIARRDNIGRPLPPTPGYTFADINRLTFNPDIALTTVYGAKRRFDQVSASVRTEQAHWNGSLSMTYTRLRGNIGGLTGFGTTGTAFSAGAAVRPNEALNYYGDLPNYPPFESKMWITGEMPWGIRAGAFATLSVGNYFTPTFQVDPRFSFQASNLLLDDALFNGVRGQTILLEQRGNRSYPKHPNLDLRLERRFAAPGFNWVFTGDLFNAFASDAIVERNLTINNQATVDPTSIFAAPRRRVNPLALQLGLRIEF
ncbi:MAG: TonB-dependent receptor [Gemmatimonadales bacterium]